MQEQEVQEQEVQDEVSLPAGNEELLMEMPVKVSRAHERLINRMYVFSLPIPLMFPRYEVI